MDGSGCFSYWTKKISQTQSAGFQLLCLSLCSWQDSTLHFGWGTVLSNSAIQSSARYIHKNSEHFLINSSLKCCCLRTVHQVSCPMHNPCSMFPVSYQAWSHCGTNIYEKVRTKQSKVDIWFLKPTFSKFLRRKRLIFSKEKW